MSKDEKKTKKTLAKGTKKGVEKNVEKKSGKKEKVAKAPKADKKKKAKKVFQVPEVLRPDSLAAIFQQSVVELEDASEKVKALPKKDLKFLIENFVAVVVGHLENGGKFQYMPLLTLEPKARLPRLGRNPSTGEPLKIKGSRYVSFRQGKGLKEIMNRDETKVKSAIDTTKAMRAEKEAKAKARKAEKEAKEGKKSSKRKSA